MELVQGLELIWAEDIIETCLFSGEPVYAELAEVVFIGQKRIRVDLELGYCYESGIWYGLLDQMGEVLDEEGDLTPADIERFQINRQDVQAGVLFDPIGLIPWEAFRESAAEFDARMAGPTPTPEETRALRVLSEVWQLGSRVASWVRDDDGALTLSYVAIVMDEEGFVRHFALAGGAPHTGTQLADVVREATMKTQGEEEPGRPLEVVLEDEALAAELAEALSEDGIAVRVGETPMVHEALDHMVGQMHKGPDLPWFMDYTQQELQEYLRAARTFFRLKPWDRFAGQKYIAFQFDDEPWGYLNVMGQMGEEHGLSMFSDWLQVCRFNNNPATLYDLLTDEGGHRPLFAAGAMEGLTLEPEEYLHPEDAHHLKSLGLRPLKGSLWPVPRRYVPGGVDSPMHSLFAYRDLMEALAQVMQARRTTRIASVKKTLSVNGRKVSLRYPAKGLEGAPDEVEGYRMIIYGRRLEGYADFFPKDTRLEIEAPGTTKLDVLARAIKKEGNQWITGFIHEGYFLWSGQEGPGTPSPTLRQAAGLSPLQAEIAMEPFTMRILPMMGLETKEIQVKLKKN